MVKSELWREMRQLMGDLVKNQLDGLDFGGFLQEMSRKRGCSAYPCWSICKSYKACRALSGFKAKNHEVL